jgi:hypothetical protein
MALVDPPPPAGQTAKSGVQFVGLVFRRNSLLGVNSTFLRVGNAPSHRPGCNGQNLAVCDCEFLDMLRH